MGDLRRPPGGLAAFDEKLYGRAAHDPDIYAAVARLAETAKSGESDGKMPTSGWRRPHAERRSGTVANRRINADSTTTGSAASSVSHNARSVSWSRQETVGDEVGEDLGHERDSCGDLRIRDLKDRQKSRSFVLHLAKRST